MIKTIFFDIGGVLLNIYPDRTIRYISDITNLSEKKIQNAFPEEAHKKYECGEISCSEFYDAVENNLPALKSISEEQFWNAWSLLVGEETEVVGIMNKLTSMYPVWLLSNTNPYHIIEEERFKLFDKIMGGIYSFEVGCRKPGENIYLKALETAETSAKESLFIDDLIENVETARSLNMNAIHFKTIEDFTEQLGKFIEL